MAGYLASSIPHKADLGYFTNLDKKRKLKRKRNPKQAPAVTNNAKPFVVHASAGPLCALSLPLHLWYCLRLEVQVNRLLAIFHTLLKHGDLEVNIMDTHADVSSFVTVGHFSKVTQKGLLGTRYRCIADKSFVEAVASQPENRHLHDWVLHVGQ